jgi:2-oxoglutarate-dependent dioxygenase
MVAASVVDPVQPLQLSRGEIKFYENEGFLLIPGLISEDTARELNGEVMEIMRIIGLKTQKLLQSREYLENSGLHRLVDSRNLLSIASQLMGGPSRLYLPFTAVKGSGGGRFHFHQDNNYTRFDGPGINLWFALEPMSPENGCLQVVPRSHLGGTLSSIVSGDGDGHQKVTFEPEDFLPVRMRPGDCIAFTRLTIHGSGPNSTPNPRVAYAVQYHRDDVSKVDKQTGEKKLLRDFPVYQNGPVKQISVPEGKNDGH